MRAAQQFRVPSIPVAASSVFVCWTMNGKTASLDALSAGGPSGSGKTSLARKMANIVGCEVISMENYYKGDEVKDSSYDDFSALDLPLLLRVMICVRQ